MAGALTTEPPYDSKGRLESVRRKHPSPGTSSGRRWRT
jgi:hypothetical protein